MFHRRTLLLAPLVLTSLLVPSGLPRVFSQTCATCQNPRVDDSDTSDVDTTSHTDSKAAAVATVPGRAGDNSWTIHSHVVEVTVSFAVTKGHKPIYDLTKQEVSVMDDDQPAVKISAFGHQSDLPLKLGLLIDTSDSVTNRFKFEQEASSRFLRAIVRPRMDRAFVMGFSEQMHLTQDYTDDWDKLATGVSTLRANGTTALLDAVRASCEKLAGAPESGPTVRILVLLSDGDDNASKSTLQQAIDTAQRSEVTIYTISVNDAMNGTPGDHVLKELAKQTGGQVFWPGSASNTARAFNSIQKDMRNRYALAYQPANLQEDGRFHHIEIRAQRSNKKFHVYARKGYNATASARTTAANCSRSLGAAGCSE